jgi:NAD(P)-dependent dehydrogenase (short-subunit alcohol dehydrogenase family)
MNKPVCLILGAGAGIGGNVAKRFAREGYHACLGRRSDKSGLDHDGLLIPAEMANT